MLRKSALLLSFVLLALIAVLTVACGKSANNNIFKSCTGGPYNVVGNWQMNLTLTGNGSESFYGAIDSSGLALFFDTDLINASAGDTLQLPQITGTCSYSGNVTAYAEPGGPASGNTVVDPIQGNVNSTSSISGTLSGNPSGTIAGTPTTPLSGSVTAFSGAGFVGQVQGSFPLGGVFLQLTFTPTGTGASMTFTAPGAQSCNATGSFTQQGSSNVFDVTMTFSGVNCPITSATALTGLGFESDTDYFVMNGSQPGPYLYADMLNGSSSFVMEIYPVGAR